MNISDLKQNQTNNPSNQETASNSSVTESLEPLNASELTTETTSLTETTIQDQKQDIMNHLKQSNGDFSYFSTEAKERSSQIKEHIQKSLSWEKAEIGVL